MKEYPLALSVLILIFLLFGCSAFEPSNTHQTLTSVVEDLTLLKKQLEDVMNDIKELKGRIEELEKAGRLENDELQGLKKDVKEVEKQLSMSQATLTILSSRFDIFQEKMKTLESKYGKLSFDLVTTHENLSGELLELRRELEDVQARLEGISEDFSGLKKSVTELNVEVSKLRLQPSFLETIKPVFDRLQSIEKQLNLLKFENARFTEDMKKQYAVIDAEVQELMSRVEKVETELRSSQELIGKLTATNTTASVDVESIIRYITKLQERVKSVEEKYSKQEMKYESLEESIYNYMTNQITSLKNTVDSMHRTLAFSSDTMVRFKDEIKSIRAELNTLKMELPALKASDHSTMIVVGESKKVEKLEEALESVAEEFALKLRDLRASFKQLELVIKDTDVSDIFPIDGGRIKYQIQKGDTLAKISEAFGMGPGGVETLIRINKIADPRRLQIGQVIEIPIKDMASIFTWPLSSRKRTDFKSILRFFGERMGVGVYPGVDIKVDIADVVRTILPGKVISVSSVNGLLSVKVYHGEDLVSVYSNMKIVYVREGDFVRTGQPLGKLGRTREGYVLHLELWKDGEPKDPVRLLYKLAGSFEITFYTEWEDGKTYYDPDFRVTKSGKIPRPWLTVAADPSIFPLGTVLYIPDLAPYVDGPPFFVVEDVGGSIKGNKLDIYVDDINFALTNKFECRVYYWGL